MSKEKFKRGNWSLVNVDLFLFHAKLKSEVHIYIYMCVCKSCLYISEIKNQVDILEGTNNSPSKI